LVPLAYRLSDTADAAKPDYVKAMATLPSGDVVATLIQSDTIVVDDAGHTLKGSGSDVGVIVYDRNTGEAKTAFSFGGAAPRVVPHGLAADASGNIVVIGYAAGTGIGSSSVDFGAGLVTFNGGEVPFVAKFSPSGLLQWAHVLQGTVGVSPAGCTGSNCDRAWDVAISSSGDIGVVGGFSGQLSLPGGTRLAAAGGSDIFVLVLNAYGVQQAAWTIGGAGNEGGFAGTVASPGGLGEMSIAASGSEWIVQGTFGPSTDFRGTESTSTLHSPLNGVRDVFVARYSGQGRLSAPVWMARATSDVTGGLAAPGALRTDAIGNLYLSLRFNPGVQTVSGCSTPTLSGERLHTLSLTPSFSCRWITRFDFAPGGIHRTVPDAVGNVYLAGWFTGSHAFPNQTLTSRSTRSDVFLARLDASTGVAQWGSGLFATQAVAAPNIPAGLAVDANGHPWIGGQFFASTEFAQTALGQASKVLAVSYTGAIVGNSNDGFVASFRPENGLLR